MIVMRVTGMALRDVGGAGAPGAILPNGMATARAAEKIGRGWR